MTISPVRFSIVLPCYNEAPNLPALLERYRAVWRDLPTELVLVNNGSTDETAQILATELSRPEYAFARSVLVPVNRGYGHGLAQGLASAAGEIVGFSHADHQCDPADLFAAFDRLVAEPDVERVAVKGKRQRRELGAELLTRGMGLLASVVLRMSLTDINAQPKVFHRSHLASMVDPPSGFQFDLYVLYRLRMNGARIVTIPVRFGRRAHGVSKWAFSLRSRVTMITGMIRYIFTLKSMHAGH